MQQNVPYRYYVACASEQHEEVEHRVHVFALVAHIKQRAGDISHTLSHNPRHCTCRDTVYQRLESHKHAQAHAYVGKGLNVAMAFEMVEGDYRAHYGAKPHEAEQCPSPQALVAKCHEGYWGIGARNMPIYGGVVPLA